MSEAAASARARTLLAAAGAAAFLLARSPGLLSYAASRPSAFAGAPAALVSRLLDAACAAAVLLGAAALGRRALARAEPDGEDAPREERWLRGAACGGVALSFLAWALLAARLLTPAVAMALVLALALAAWLDRGALAALRLPAPQDALEAAALTVVLAALGQGAIRASAPPTDWDTLVYHFALPKLYLAEGFHRLPWSWQSHLPLSAEALDAVLLSARGDLAAQWLGFWHGPLLLGAAAALASRAGGRRAGWLAAAALAAQPAFDRVLGVGKNDLQASLAIVLALSAAARGRWAAAGLLCGAAASVKLTGLWALGAVGTLALSRARSGGFRPALAVAAGFCVLGLPWYARDLAWTGSPVWPLLGLGRDAGPLYARLRAADTGGAPRTLLNFLLSPLSLAFRPALFLQPPSSLLWAAPALFWAGRHAARPRGAWLSLCALFFCAWFWVSQDGRFLLPLDALLAAGLAALAAAAPAAGARRAAALAALLVAVSPAAALTPNNELFGALEVRPADGGAPRDGYLRRALGLPFALSRDAGALPARARLFLYRDFRGYYLERPYEFGNALDGGASLVAGAADAEDLRARLRAAGFTHLAYNATLGQYHGDAAYYERADRLVEELLSRSRVVAREGPLALAELP